ncbi:type-F conjugative transfer system secretin TraK [Erythrobacter sp. EC-HK427]|uniref:type-F conjugative transfer system secretin TraK n=1 Tax=Erythrobacter sp. EC-HK427 TaxID=2038396 RepID=UPI00125B4E6E|nr:type-F conjugative transfer system secretin TraK [Erythrobacter sp. EC-HK427]VVT00601.1 Conjugal transfer protein TraK [Erythrobacter sp. EC-HK427]
MSLLHNSTTALLAATGIALCGLGAGQRRDIALKLAGMAALGAAFMPSPALADQFIEASDGATIDCELARGELSRIALIDDGFANVSKIASGFPYNDFQVTHEPVRGDIYISVPPQFAAARVTFFATSQAGFVYKFACRLAGEDATQIFITNPALRQSEAAEWEAETAPEDTAIRLIEAMAGDAVLPGFTARAEISAPRRTGGIEVQRVAEYRGAALTGQSFLIRNLGDQDLLLAAEREAPAGALAFAYGRDVLPPGEATRAFLVFARGGID